MRFFKVIFFWKIFSSLKIEKKKEEKKTMFYYLKKFVSISFLLQQENFKSKLIFI